MARASWLSLTVLLAVLAGAPVRSAALPGPVLSQSAMLWAFGGFELGAWEAYLARNLTPDLAAVARVNVPRISWVKIDQDIVLPDFARNLISASDPARLSLVNARVRSALQFGQLPGGEDGRSSPGFERTVVLSGLSGQLGGKSSLNVSAVLASQQFSHSMMDVSEYDGIFRPVDFFAANRDPSQGAGLQLGFASELAPRLMMDASYQSRINMDELASLRGVQSFAADIDIPSRVRMGLNLEALENTLFTFAVSQVFYSDVGAFPTRALPARFNALLADSSSPRFEWDDLTVYSVGMRWKHESDLELNIDFHTRSQPSPTSRSLVAALGDELAQHSVMVGLGKGIGERTRVDFTASYAPPEFAFGGNVLGLVSDRLDQAVELAARLNIRF